MSLKLHKPGALFALAAALAAAPPAPAVAPAHPSPIYREGEVLVKYRAGAAPAQLEAVKAKLGLVAKRRIAAGRVELLKLPSPLTTLQALAVLRADPAIEHVEPNFRRVPRAVIPDDTFFGQQWGLRNTGQANFISGGPAGIAGADLNMTQAWDSDGNGTADRIGIPSVIVAVIDDAIDFDHPDFTPNIVSRHNFIDCQDPDDPGPVTSQGSHGTLTSGCIAAVGDNGLGVAGIAWGASLMPLKFGFDSASHIEALNWARDHGAKVINASFGGPGFSQVEEDLIADLAASDILYVASSGNEDSNTDLAQLNYPANYDADNIVSVAATNRQDNIASFSQYGPLTVDVAAPGLQIVTTRINGAYSTNPGVSGTSFSSPYAAGVAALVKSHVSPAPDWREIKARLIESGSAPGGANPKARTSGGRIDADKALDLPDQPSLVVRNVSFDDVGGNGNGLPDPAEAVSVTFTVRNLWQGATGVTATLAADNGVTVDTVGPQALGTIASQGEADVTFLLGIPNVTGHHYVNLTLTLSADGAYTATRGAGFEIGTLAPGVQAAQPFTGEAYDEFHAWHATIPAQTGTKTLFINTSTAGGQDIDLLVKRGVPPRYSITVGINPEVTAGFFCTSGTTADCSDPDTLVSGRIDGTEAVSIVNPPAGTYHLVVVNFDQQALNYTVEAVLLDGDLRPNAFSFTPVSNVPDNTLATSNPITVAGIDAPTPITVVGGEYSISDGTFTSSPGSVSTGQTVRLRVNSGSGFAHASVTIGGVTGTFYVNPPPPPEFDSGDTACNTDTGGNGCAGFHCGSGGRLPPSVLAVLLLGTLARRRRTS